MIRPAQGSAESLPLRAGLASRRRSRHRLPLLLLLLLSSLRVAGASPAAPPNIVLILADDLGINDLACYGRADHRTPHLDRLAAEGTRFTSAYCAQPICSPSRAALLTGKHPARLHLTTFLPGRPDTPAQPLLHPPMRQSLPLEETTLAEWLRRSGYATACIGKWHLGGEGFGPTDQGFEFSHPGRANTLPTDTEGGKGETDLTTAAIDFIDRHRQRPFFLYLAHHSPHIPYSAPAARVLSNTHAFEPAYAALIEILDTSIGRLRQHLARQGLATNTLFLFTSDNGGLHVPELNHRRITHNTPFRAGKGFLYEGGLRVPALIAWSGHLPAGRRVDAPILNTDWLPTLLDLAGLPVPSGLDGFSLANLLRGGPMPPERPLYWHFPHYTNQGGRPAGATRQGDWKLIESYEDNRLELYNLAADPGEQRNLAARHPDRQHHLQHLLAAWRQSIHAQTNLPNPALDPPTHQRLYLEIDISRYDPTRASPADFTRVLQWRRDMDLVASSRKPLPPPANTP